MIKPKYSQYPFIQSYSNGLIIDAENDVEGTVVKLKQMSASMHQHFCVTADGQIIHMTSKLALTVSSPNPASGTSVRLSKLEENNKQQIWTFMPNGYIQTAANPTLVLAVSSDNVSVIVVSKSTGAPKPTELWYGLYGKQFLYNNGLNRSVMEAEEVNKGAETLAIPKKTQTQQISPGTL